MYTYRDPIFRGYHKMIRNIPWLKKLSFKSRRNICLNFSRAKYSQGATIINFGELNPYTFFVLKGAIGVHVHNKLGLREQMGDEIGIPEHKFQHLTASSSVNFVSSYLKHESLFTIKVEEDTEIMKLHRDDLIEIAMEDVELRDVLDKLKTKYELEG